MGNSRIQIFSQTGCFLNKFGNKYLKQPYGILVHLGNIFVTDIYLHAIFQFELIYLKMVKRAGKEGSGNEDFDSPSQLDISPNEHLYVADEVNNRLQILTTNLEFQGSLRHPSMFQPVDVKFTSNEIFVLSSEDNPCIHIFTLSGDKSRSLITCGNGMQVDHALFFCLDGNDNIVISDIQANCIKIFSPEGDLLHTIGQEGDRAGMFYSPSGVTILKGKTLICVSRNFNLGLQIFFA